MVRLAAGVAVATEHIRHFRSRPGHGRALRSVLARRASARSGSGGAAGRAGWLSRRPCWWRCAGTGPWSPGCGGRAATESCGHRSRTQVNERRTRDARPSHTAHDLHSTRICYRCHPFYGIEVEVIRHLRKIDAVILIVRLPGGMQVAIPEWMLNAQICDRFTNESEPRVSIDALLVLRRLIDAHRLGKTAPDHGCAESPSGGRNAQQRKSVRVATQAALRGRRSLDRASGIGKGTVPKSVASGARKRSQDRPREAE